MVGEVVDSREWAGELASGGLIIIPHIGHHIIKLENFTALVLFAQTSVEGYFRAVE